MNGFVVLARSCVAASYPQVDVAFLGALRRWTSAAAVFTYFDRPGASNRLTGATNGRLECLRGSALGFRNFTIYIARSLVESGGFRNQLHPRL